MLSRRSAHPSCITLFSVAANGAPVNQVTTLASDSGSMERRYSASKRIFSNLLRIEAIARQTCARDSKELPGSGGRTAATGSGFGGALTNGALLRLEVPGA